jgi:hypothetical protein
LSNIDDPQDLTKLANVPQRAGRLTLYGPPPLIEGEDGAVYDELLARISGAVKPSDILEEIWVRDIIDLVWDTLRLRRLKASLINAAAAAGLERVQRSFRHQGSAQHEPPSSLQPSPVAEVASESTSRDRAAIRRDQLLASAGLTMDEVMAQALSIKIDDVERIDRMIMTAEARRNAALRELDRHRATLGRQLRRLAQEAEDAEFEVIEARPVANENAA